MSSLREIALLDRFVATLQRKGRARPSLPIVAGSIIVACALWFLIYAVTGRLVWLW